MKWFFWVIYPWAELIGQNACIYLILVTISILFSEWLPQFMVPPIGHKDSCILTSWSKVGTSIFANYWQANMWKEISYFNLYFWPLMIWDISSGIKFFLLSFSINCLFISCVHLLFYCFVFLLDLRALDILDISALSVLDCAYIVFHYVTHMIYLSIMSVLVS